MQIERLLVTTADERSWCPEVSTLFLGEWCLLYSRQDFWSKMDAIVIDSNNNNFAVKKSQYEYLEYLYLDILSELTCSLNEFHSLNFSQRYWTILLGHWVKRCIDTIFNRYYSIEYALKTYKVNGSILFESDSVNIATTDSASFVWACNNSVWNNIIYGKILKYMGCINLKTIPIKNSNKINSFIPANSFIKNTFKTKKITKKLIDNILSLLGKKNDAVIIGSYLPCWGAVKLQIALWQCPQVWSTPSFPSEPVINSSREGFRINTNDHKGFDFFIRDMIPQLMPICYLEGYKKLTLMAEQLPWPIKPKFIFTSNSFDYDEVFKVWAAEKVVHHRVPYFTGQHGNNYGSHLNYGLPILPERITSDGFFAWGSWGNKEFNVIPSFMFKMGGRKNIAHNVTGPLLLVEQGVPLRIYADDPYSIYEQYQESQFLFVKSLPSHIASEVQVRLFRHEGSDVWSDRERWRDRSPKTKLVDDKASDPTILDLFAQSRVAVFSFDSTGILEALFLNMPLVCFWSGGLSHLLPSAKPYYQLLIDANILFDDPVLAAGHISRNWETIDQWWSSQVVQNARRVFCERFAATEKHPTFKLKELLTERTKIINNRNATSYTNSK